MSEKDRLEKKLRVAESNLARTKHLEEKHAERSNHEQKKLAREYVDHDSEKVRKLRRQLGKER